MSFYQQFIKSFYKFEEYPLLAKVNSFRTVIYVFILSLLASFLYIVPIVADYYNMGGFTGIIDKYVPEFEIKNGKLIMNADIDYESLTKEMIIIADTNTKVDVSMLEDYMSGILVDDEKMILRSAGYTYSLNFKDVDNTTKEDIYKMIPVFKQMSIIIIFVFIFFYILSNYIAVLMFNFIAIIINRFIGANVTFSESLKISAYSRTMPFILRIILMFFGIPMDLTVYCFVVCTYIYLGLKNIKNQNGRIIAVL